MVIFHSYVKLPEGKSRFKLHFQFSCTTQSGRENRNAASSNVTWHKLETHWAGAADGCQDLSILTGTCPDRSATANFVTSSWCCLEQICGWHFSICVLCKIISRPFAHNIYLSIYRLYICIQSGLWSYYYYFAQDIARSSKPTTFPMPLPLDSCVIALTYRRHGCPSLTNIET